jgi:catechol 2,3-dioxygenase-like lactoylglutathione lyase family enzyme
MNEAPVPRLSWPDHLAATGAVRFSHSSAEYDRTIAFYRNVVGLPFISEFTESFGEDGTIFGLPGLTAHLEIVRRRGSALDVDPLDQLVLYLSGAAAVAAVAERLDQAGVPRDPSPHPYWSARGGRVFLDPDGRRVVFAPWVFGREQEPETDSSARPVRSSSPGTAGTVLAAQETASPGLPRALEPADERATTSP